MDSNLTFASPADALRALFSAWPADRGEGTGLTEAYIIAIQGYSLKAIDDAVTRIIRGEIDDIDRRFLPSPAQLGNLCAYLEKVHAPVERKRSLPTHDDRPAADDEVAWHRRRAIAEAAQARFAPATSPMTKPMTEAEFDDWARLEAARIRKESAQGKYVLSAAARATFSKERLDAIAVPSPDEQYDAWERLPPAHPRTERAA